MKCPNCGGENTGKFCKFCGSEMPNTVTPVFVTNNFFGENSESQNQNEASGSCPKCGSTKIGFKRERTGTNAISTTRKKYIGYGRKGTYNSTAQYRTVGLCQSCGYAWVPSSSSKGTEVKSNTIWWVLGWIFIFPVPLMILLRRNKSLNKWLKYGIIALAWLVYAIWIGSAMIRNKKTTSTGTGKDVSNENQIVTDTETEPNETAEVLQTIYQDDEKINLFVNRFNTLNPDFVLTEEDMTKYYHHGREHDDQVKFFRNDYQIVITGGKIVSKTSVSVSNSSLVKHTTEEFEVMFIRFAKVYAPDLTDTQLKEYWVEIVEDLSSVTEFEEFECTKSNVSGFEYFKLEGKVS